MDLWDYYEWEAKKYRCGVNYALKITSANQLEYITIVLQIIICVMNKWWRKFM